jgi:hypothetical protein
MFLCKNMCFHLLCVTMINNCPRNLSISDFCNWEQRVKDASTHTPKSWDKQFNTCRSPAASRRLECCSKATSNSAQRLLQCCSKVPPILLERCSNAVWSRNRNWTKLTIPLYRQARTCRSYEKDQFLVQDQGTLRVRVFQYFVLPPPLSSSTHSIKTRLLDIRQRCAGWLLCVLASSRFFGLCRGLVFIFIVGCSFELISLFFSCECFVTAAEKWLEKCMLLVSSSYISGLGKWFVFFLSFWVCF